MKAVKGETFQNGDTKFRLLSGKRYWNKWSGKHVVTTV
jgi:hypothetical protein